MILGIDTILYINVYIPLLKGVIISLLLFTNNSDIIGYRIYGNQSNYTILGHCTFFHLVHATAKVRPETGMYHEYQ